MSQEKKKEVTKRLVDSEENEELDMDVIEKASDDDGFLKYIVARYGENIYRDIILYLTHKKYTDSEAKHLWKSISCHRNSLSKRVGRDVGISVATLDYMKNIAGEMDDVRIIEEELVDDISRLAIKDSLTGLYTRRVFEVFLEESVNEHRRYGHTFSLALADVDDFKKINDTFGHDMGDEVLKNISAIFNNSIRDVDIAARFGGEEIALIMPNTDKTPALELLERIQKTVEGALVDDIKFTISVGVATCPENGTSSVDLVKSVDDALYDAKGSGKNRVVGSGT